MGGHVRRNTHERAVAVESVSPNRTLCFSYKCNLPAGANHYRFELIDGVATNYSYWGYTLTPVTNGNWYPVTVPFSALTPSFTPAGATWANAKAQILGFQVKPQNASATLPMNFDIYFDDVHFN